MLEFIIIFSIFVIFFLCIWIENKVYQKYFDKEVKVGGEWYYHRRFWGYTDSYKDKEKYKITILEIYSEKYTQEKKVKFLRHDSNIEDTIISTSFYDIFTQDI